MSNKYLSGALAPPTQQETAPGTVENTAGGQAFKVDSWDRLDRFLILGSEGGTYYASERTLTLENVASLRDLIVEDGIRFVSRIVEISKAGRAPKNDPALLALALAASIGGNETRSAALAVLPEVARTGTHLFTFLGFVEQLRGWGRGLRNAVGNWYTEKSDDALGYQLVKYRQRNGWTHADALRLAHPKAKTFSQGELLRFAAGKLDVPGAQKHLGLFYALQRAEAPADVVRLIELGEGAVVREMLKPEHAGNADVQKALLKQGMPLTAMIRNLGNLTRLGVLKPATLETQRVINALTDEGRVQKARVHPMTVLIAMRTYESGGGYRSGKNWDPIPSVIDALDDAFYLAFGNVEPTGKRTMLALDVSGSMGSGEIAGAPGLVPRDASAAMAMVTARAERDYYCYGFTARTGWNWSYNMDGGDKDGFVPLAITPKTKLTEAISIVQRQNFGATDCALPMIVAKEKGLEIDTFVIYTDNETWAGSIHPDEALRQYRRASGIPAKLVVVGMTATDFSIANPNDAGMLDVVGFDSATPQIISEFSK